jgi:hypothetical protein
VALDTEVSREEIEVAGQQLGEREKRAESREREREREQRHACFGKWFTEIFSVNRFPKFTEGFSGQKNKRFPLTRFYSETNVRK